MKLLKSTALGIFFIFLVSLITACGSGKYATQRRNLMLPRKSEVPINSKYKEVTKRKTNKVKTKKAKRKSLY